MLTLLAVVVLVACLFKPRLVPWIAGALVLFVLAVLLSALWNGHNEAKRRSYAERAAG